METLAEKEERIKRFQLAKELEKTKPLPEYTQYSKASKKRPAYDDPDEKKERIRRFQLARTSKKNPSSEETRHFNISTKPPAHDDPEWLEIPQDIREVSFKHRVHKSHV